MDAEKNKHETTKQHKGKSRSISDTTQNILERGAEVYEEAEQAVGNVYDKTAQAVSETYEKTKSYSEENPGKTVLIALGIGVGVGFLLGTRSRRSRTGRFAQPVVNALSEIALELFR